VNREVLSVAVTPLGGVASYAVASQPWFEAGLAGLVAAVALGSLGTALCVWVALYVLGRLLRRTGTSRWIDDACADDIDTMDRLDGAFGGRQ